MVPMVPSGSLLMSPSPSFLFTLPPLPQPQPQPDDEVQLPTHLHSCLSQLGNERSGGQSSLRTRSNPDGRVLHSEAVAVAGARVHREWREVGALCLVEL